MPGTEVLVQIVLGLAAIGAVVGVLRWSWNSRKREGSTAEKAEALEGAVVDADARDSRTRSERAKSHAEWKRAGKNRRGRRRPR